jgi:hypothetical protein
VQSEQVFNDEYSHVLISATTNVTSNDATMRENSLLLIIVRRRLFDYYSTLIFRSKQRQLTTNPMTTNSSSSFTAELEALRRKLSVEADNIIISVMPKKLVHLNDLLSVGVPKLG